MKVKLFEAARFADQFELTDPHIRSELRNELEKSINEFLSSVNTSRFGVYKVQSVTYTGPTVTGEMLSYGAMVHYHE